MLHEYLGNSIEFNVIYKKRKTIEIYIDCYGNLEIRAPKDTNMEQISKVVESKWEWIQMKTSEMKKRNSGTLEKIYEHGETFLYLGRAYPIIIMVEESIDKNNVIFQEEKLKVYVKKDEEEQIKQALKRFFYQQCKLIVDKRIRFYLGEFKMKPSSTRISDDSKNWGTCSSKRELTFNWKLAMAPIDVIDYVVIHELCHMVHMNHDRSFWRLVGKYMPDYEKRKNWLDCSSWKMIL